MVAAASVLCIGGVGCGKAEDPQGRCALDAPECRRNVLATCGDAGVVETPCDPGRCAFDAPVPLCVPAAALPCDPATTPPTCEGGHLLTCTEEAGYKLATECAEGEICSPRKTPAKCVPLADEACDSASFQPLCVGGRRVVCDEESGRLAEGGRCEAPPP